MHTCRFRGSVTIHFFPAQGGVLSDGHAFTADDVVFTWNAFFAKGSSNRKALLDDQGRPQYRYNTRATFSQQTMEEPIIEKLDVYTVRFTTPEVRALLLFGADRPFCPTCSAGGLEDGSLLDQWSLETAIAAT